jgi:transposase
MFVDSSSVKRGNKTYTRHLLRESYRDGGKVKHRTIANLSACSPEEIEAIRLALSHKHSLAELGSVKESLKLCQGRSVGALVLLLDLARQVGLPEVLGSDREGTLALWQILARVIDQGSRLSATRLARVHAVPELLGLTFNENDLYQNLDWLCEHQTEIEGRLSRNEEGGLFLYDVTSSYVEGECNELAAFGYNRDGKPKKRQIVVGLLCNGKGQPLCIEVFEGNTQDPKTFVSQVKKVASRFGDAEITFVGDRGMIKSKQIDALGEQGFHYITAITKPQVERLLNEGVLQMSLFDDALAEVEDDAIRYILRRNPQRAQEMAESRQEKFASLVKRLNERNTYLAGHPRAKPEVALARLNAHAKKLGLAHCVSIVQEDRTFQLARNEEAIAEHAKLDGCYVLKTDLPIQCACKEQVHARYKDLAQVEWAFRTAKTTHLEMRPLYVRLETRTRGHALVVMLAYRLVQELSLRWNSLDLTVQEGIDQLAQLCLVEVQVKNQVPYVQIPEPNAEIHQLLKLAGVKLPSALPGPKGKVSTKTKLQNQRKRA